MALSKTASTALGSAIALLFGLVVGYATGESANQEGPVTEAEAPVAPETESSPLPPAEGASETTAGSPAAESTGAGASLDSPIPVGSEGAVGQWEVQVTGFTPNASEAVRRENSFNTKPGPGEQYVLVTLKTTYTGNGSADPWAEQTWAAITPAGDLFEEAGQVWPKDLNNVGNVPSGVSGTGNVGFLVPSDAARDLTLYIEAPKPGSFNPEGVFFALS
jgi:hypothetical protein